QHRIDAVVREMPIDYLARSEQYEIHKALGQDAKAKALWAELLRLLSREPDSVLELTFDYAGAGRRVEAKHILEEAIRQMTAGQAKSVNPLLHYTLGYFYEIDGDRTRARAEYQLGSKGNTAFVFPHRVEEIAVLRTALAASPSDGP